MEVQQPHRSWRPHPRAEFGNFTEFARSKHQTVMVPARHGSKGATPRTWPGASRPTQPSPWVSRIGDGSVLDRPSIERPLLESGRPFSTAARATGSCSLLAPSAEGNWRT